MEKITVNGVDYYSQDNSNDIRIVILQRGWVMIGRLIKNGSDCKLLNSSVIEKWGTTEGLGELASKGKRENTILRKNYGMVEFDYLTVVATISCSEEQWKNEL